jgi:class 3 adenylate cyclase
VRVRIGIHSGEASAAGERYVGFSAHRAARHGAIGHGGQILISSATRELVEDELPDGVTLRDLSRTYSGPSGSRRSPCAGCRGSSLRRRAGRDAI